MQLCTSFSGIFIGLRIEYIEVVRLQLYSIAVPHTRKCEDQVS
jgi:hypothetical protein